MRAEQPQGPAGVSASVQKREDPVGTAAILVVDDESISRYMLSQLVTHLGHRVAVAEDGRQALEKLQAENFELVLLDMRMPEMDGDAVLERMKADSHLRQIPV